MYKIPIFSAEREANLVEAIQSQTSIAYTSLAELSERVTVDDAAKAKLGQSKQHAKASTGDFDLHYLKTLLVSVGWNKNDDVFDPLEVWSARATPEDKPFNYEHDCSQIIGHITSNHVIDEDGKVVADDSTVESLPSKFHVVTGAVLYKYWAKSDLQEKMDQILKDVADDKKYVSMEALFKGFDYALVDKSGAARIVARNQETAFLTKHLRVYGGTGKYKDLQVGRVLRNIVFSGKGLVEKPANPESIIFTEAKVHQFSQANFTDIFHSDAKSGYSTVMPQVADISTEQKQMTTAEIELLQKQVAELTAANIKLSESLRDNDVKQVQAKLDTITAEKTKTDELLKVAEANVKAEKDAREKAEAEKKTLLEKSEATEAELAKIKLEQKTAVRVAYAVKLLKFEDAKAVEYVETLAGLSDEAFTKNIDTIAATVAVSTNPQSGNTAFPHKEVKTPPKATSVPVGPKATSVPSGAGKTSAAETDPAQVNAQVTSLETPAVENTVALATEPADDGVEKVRASIAEMFGVTESK